MVDLFENSHCSKFESVVAELEWHSDANNTDFEAFDHYELEDVELSQMLLLSLLSSRFHEKWRSDLIIASTLNTYLVPASSSWLLILAMPLLLMMLTELVISLTHFCSTPTPERT
jgi:hypothetical protein